MKPRRTSSLCIETYKNLYKLNPEFRRDLYRFNVTNKLQRERFKFYLDIPKSNSLQYYIELAENLSFLKKDKVLAQKDLRLQRLFNFWYKTFFIE